MDESDSDDSGSNSSEKQWKQPVPLKEEIKEIVKKTERKPEIVGAVEEEIQQLDHGKHTIEIQRTVEIHQPKEKVEEVKHEFQPVLVEADQHAEIQTSKTSFVKDFFISDPRPDYEKFQEPQKKEEKVQLENPYLKMQEDFPKQEEKGLSSRVKEIATSITVKTADLIAKPVLQIISSKDIEKFNQEHEEPLSACLDQQAFFVNGTSPENFQHTGSRTLKNSNTHNFKSFTMPLNYKAQELIEDEKTLPEKKNKQDEEDDDDDNNLDEDEAARILRMIEQESDSDDEEAGSDDDSDDDSQEDEEKQEKTAMGKEQADAKQGSDNGSICSEEDILNRSLLSDCEEAIVSANYLRYASDKFAQKQDLLEVVDKNERSFKQVAEKMIMQSSQLVSHQKEGEQSEGADGTPGRRLMHGKQFKKIADRFHGDIKVAQGVPYSIAALEDILAVGSSDGTVRLFDNSEQEIKILQDKSVKANAVTCLDIKRIGEKKEIFVCSGHAKGQIAVYVVKGLFQQAEFLARQNSKDSVKMLQDNLFGNVQAKHCKTLDDLHKNTVVNVKFCGDFTKDIIVLSCDLTGAVYMSTFYDGMLVFSVQKQCIMKTRLGPSYSLAPLLDFGLSDSTQAYMNAVGKIDQNVYKTMKQQQEANERHKMQKPIIVGFGTLDEIYVAQVMPKAIPMLSVS